MALCLAVNTLYYTLYYTISDKTILTPLSVYARTPSGTDAAENSNDNEVMTAGDWNFNPWFLS